MTLRILALLLFPIALFAQAAPPATPPAAHAQTPHPISAPQRLHDMQLRLQQMGTLLAGMRAEAARIADPAGQRLALDNIQMWELMLAHLQDSMVLGLRGPAPAMGRPSPPAPQSAPSITPPQPLRTPPPSAPAPPKSSVAK